MFRPIQFTDKKLCPILPPINGEPQRCHQGCAWCVIIGEINPQSICAITLLAEKALQNPSK